MVVLIFYHVVQDASISNVVVNKSFYKVKIIGGGDKMSSRIFIQDSATLALIYNYDATGSKILSLSKIEAFDSKIDRNLEEMNSKVNMVYPLDYSKLIYFKSYDENGNWYCILKPNFNREQMEINYMYKIPIDVIRASKNENALDVLGLKLEDNKIVKKEKNKVKSMSLKSEYAV